MDGPESNIDRLIKARAEIDDKLRQHKSAITVLFTDVVGSTAYFERHGDTAGLLMLHRHADLVRDRVAEFQGTVIKTIGDSVMAEFPEPVFAVQAAVQIQRHLRLLNESLAARERLQLRIGINAGIAFRDGNDVYGDAVNTAARITKRSGPAQILISRSVRDAILNERDIRCTWLGKVTMEGKAAAEDVFEVIWTDTAAYAELRADVTAALAQGELTAPGLKLEDLVQSVRKPAPVPADELPTVAVPASVAAIGERYDVLEEVGSGGMGVVYRARDRETGTIVAIKVLHAEIAGRAELIERFKTELVLARKITHKNVCRVYQLERFDNVVAISMEYIEGESLRTVLGREQGLAVRYGLKIVRQVIAGLAEAHAQGVIHRDLKPENILVARDGTVKVMDFGIARSVETGATLTGSIIGTPAYMSPEQAEGKTVDARSDIYSLGLVMYEMFSGQRAFTGDIPLTLAMKQVQETPPPPSQFEPHLPDFLNRVILKCIEKSPAKRFQSTNELDEALFHPPPAVAPVPYAAVGAEAEELNVADVSAAWTRLDTALLCSAVACAIVFFLIFSRVHPASALQISSQTQHQAAVQSVLNKLDWQARITESYIDSDPQLGYIAAFTVAGVRTAQRLIEEQAIWAWAGRLEGTGSRSAVYRVDPNGRVSHLQIPLEVLRARLQREPPNLAIPVERLSGISQMRAAAQFTVETVFGVGYSGIEPTSIGGQLLLWKRPIKEGEISETIDGYLSGPAGNVDQLVLNRTVSAEAGGDDRDQVQRVVVTFGLATIIRMPLAAFSLLVLAVILFFVRRIGQQRSASRVGVAICAGAILAVSAARLWDYPPEFERLYGTTVPLLSFCIGALIAYAVVSTVSYYLRRRAPDLLAGFSMLLQRQYPRRPAALDLLRGVSAGAVLAALWMTGIWVAGEAGVGVAGLPFLFVFAPESVSRAREILFMNAANGVLEVPWLFVALPLTLLWNTTSRHAVRLVILCGLWLLMGVSLLGAVVVPLVSYHVSVLLQAVFFGLVFLRFGLLATMSATFTIETMLFAFPMFYMFRRIDPIPYSLWIYLWVLMFLFAAVLYLWPHIDSSRRRIAAIFE